LRSSVRLKRLKKQFPIESNSKQSKSFLFMGTEFKEKFAECI